MSNDQILAAVREALETLGVIPELKRADAAPKRTYAEASTERHIEDLAREWCAAIGIDPDRPVALGIVEDGPLPYGAKFMAGTVRPAWTQFLDPAFKFAQALGIPVRKADKPGGYPLWISPESVTEFRAVPMTRDDSSI